MAMTPFAIPQPLGWAFAMKCRCNFLLITVPSLSDRGTGRLQANPVPRPKRRAARDLAGGCATRQAAAQGGC